MTCAPPQENHHVAATFLLLRNEDYNFLARSSSHVRGGREREGCEGSVGMCFSWVCWFQRLAFLVP